jgi:hypothetical protein
MSAAGSAKPGNSSAAFITGTTAIGGYPVEKFSGDAIPATGVLHLKTESPQRDEEKHVA